MSGCLSLFRRFRRDDRGVGAVEFAFIAPFLALLWIGGSELSIALSADRKVELATSTIGDVLTQIEQPTANGIRNVLNMGSSITAPYGDGTFRMKITSVWVDAKGKATVDCSLATEGIKADVKGNPYNLPPRLLTMKSRSVLVTTSTMEHRPISNLIWSAAAIEFADTSYFNPRSDIRYVWDKC